MITKKNLFLSLLAIMMVAMVSMSLSSCSKDKDDDSGSDLTGWYARTDLMTFWLELVDDDYGYFEFNSQGEVIYVSTMWGGSRQNYSTGIYNYDDPVYNIVDDNTIIRYYGSIYEYDSYAALGKKLLCKFYYPPLGMLGLYEHSAQYFTYWTDNNTLFTTEYETYLITSSGIIPNGSSFTWYKYDPEDTY